MLGNTGLEAQFIILTEVDDNAPLDQPRTRIFFFLLAKGSSINEIVEVWITFDPPIVTCLITMALVFCQHWNLIDSAFLDLNCCLRIFWISIDLILEYTYDSHHTYYPNLRYKRNCLATVIVYSVIY